MDGDDEDHEEYARALPKCHDWFHVRPVNSEEVWLARWQRELGQVTYRQGGVTGTVEVKGVSHRVHVCAHVPCTKVHNASKQKTGVVPPLHVRLMYWPPDASGHEPAVAGGESLAGDATPPMVPPIDAPVLPPSPATPPLQTPPPSAASTPLPAPVGSDTDEESVSSDVATSLGGDTGVDIEDIVRDKTALAPAPSPAFLPGEGGQDVLPPGRAALLPIPPVVPCDLRVPVPPATSKKPAVAGPEDSDDEPIFVDSGLTNPILAAKMVPFLDSMLDIGANVGIAAFVDFAFRYQLQVHVWIQDQCWDVVKEYAPWAVGFINHRPIYDAISCRVSPKEGLSLHDHDMSKMNHWVVAIGFDREDSSTVDRTREDGTESEELFFGLYLSLQRLVVKTIADGDCALDAMCLMLGVP